MTAPVPYSIFADNNAAGTNSVPKWILVLQEEKKALFRIALDLEF